MLICVESYLGDRLISGKKCSRQVLQERFTKTLAMAESGNFTELFCRMYGFDEYPMSDDVEVDFTLDLDTHKILPFLH